LLNLCNCIAIFIYLLQYDNSFIGSDATESLAKFKKLDADQKLTQTDDVYNKNWTPPKFDKNAPDYGRPKAGSLTERRGIAAGLCV
jgi:hypothetical protein